MRLTRLYCPDVVFSPAVPVALDEGQNHYVLRVLRLNDGDEIVVFNGQSGGWSARLQVTGKRAVAVVQAQIQKPTQAHDVWLLAAPLKKEAWYFVLEKATELGAAAICPVTTDYTQHARMNAERDTVNLIEASRQCERTDIPAYHKVEKLSQLLRGWDKERVLYVALERSDAVSALTAFARDNGQKAAILIGPEGGFSPAERDLFAQYDFIVPIALGDLILRAETAALSAVALWAATQQGN